jgi:hypothetical protein
MTHNGMNRRSKNHGVSPVRRSGVPIASTLLAGFSRMPTLAAEDGLHRQHAAQPRGSPSGREWSPGLPSQVRARDPAPAVPRVACANRHRCGLLDPASSGRPSVLGVAGQELVEHVAERCSHIQLGEDS